MILLVLEVIAMKIRKAIIPAAGLGTGLTGHKKAQPRRCCLLWTNRIIMTSWNLTD